LPPEQNAVQVLDEPVEEVVGRRVDAIDERIVTIDDVDASLLLLEGREVGIVQPELGARRADVRDEAPGVAGVQVTDGRCEHHDVAR
jgi:hypothetical protein